MISTNQSAVSRWTSTDGSAPLFPEVAFLKYRYLDPDHSAVEMFTTVVPPSLGGRGIAKILADEAFDWAVQNELKMKLTCWYLSGYLQRHPRDSVSKLIIS